MPYVSPNSPLDSGSPATISQVVANLPTTVPANSIAAALTNSASALQSNTYWTGASTRYLVPNDWTLPVAETVGLFRDQQVTTWCRNGVILMRLIGGKAIYFQLNLEVDSLVIGIVTGYVPGVGGPNTAGSGTWTPIQSVNIAAQIPGYNKSNDTAGNTFTFALSGFTVTCQFGGVTFFSYLEWRHLLPGAVALLAVNTYGYRDFAISLQSRAALFSTPTALGDPICNMLDFGVKTLSAVGSMTIGSPVLALVYDAGFSVGDTVIVAVGGEPGAGARGTVGVGGTWPTLSYANSTAMAADHSQANLTYAWDRSTSFVWHYVSGVWGQIDPNNWYIAQVIPRALVAAVIGKSGLNLTLSASASANTSAAPVYFDNQAILNSIAWIPGGLQALTPPNGTMQLPQGRYAMSTGVTVDHSHAGWKVQGANAATLLFWPPGVFPATDAMVGVVPANVTVQHFDMQSNFKFNGFGLFAVEIGTIVGTDYPGGVHFGIGADNGVARNMTATDFAQAAFGASSCDNTWAYDCASILTQGLQRYTQWQFEWASCTRSGFQDVSVTAPVLTAGFELFSCTDHCQMIRCTGVNAAMSCNTTDDFVIDSPSLTIQPNTQLTELSYSSQSPVITINTNTGGTPVTNGGVIKDISIVCHGFINANNDQLRGIVVNADNPNITIDGGTINYTSDYSAPSSNPGPQGVNTNGSTVNTIVRNLTVIGTTKAGPGNANIEIEGSGSIINCTANVITGPLH